MRRRDFITKSAALAGAGLIAPTILKTGTAFARGGNAKAEHVVLLMFAGGVRQQESVLQRYLEDSQGVTGAAGNIMPNLFNGAAPDRKIVYGTSLPGLPAGSEPIPRILSNTIESSGMLFREVQAQSAGHYVGLNTLLTGNAGTAQGLRTRPRYPTIFEYLRRHAGFKASECWMVANGIGNSVPLLNSSDNADYGLEYGANMFAPPVTFGSYGREILANGKSYSQQDLEPMYDIKRFLDQSFSLGQEQFNTVRNTEEERTWIKEFIRSVFAKQSLGQISMPPVGSGDGYNIAYAAEIMREFKPRMLAVNIGGVDSCHSNFTSYLSALHRADHAAGWLWQYIQNNIPEIKNNTIFIIAPECGRNLKSNPILDQNDWYAFDHSDANARRVWSLMVGSNVPQMSVGNESNPVGRLTDIVPTIADIFGIYDEVMASGYIDPLAKSMFQRV